MTRLQALPGLERPIQVDASWKLDHADQLERDVGVMQNTLAHVENVIELAERSAQPRLAECGRGFAAELRCWRNDLAEEARALRAAAHES